MEGFALPGALASVGGVAVPAGLGGMEGAALPDGLEGVLVLTGGLAAVVLLLVDALATVVLEEVPVPALEAAAASAWPLPATGAVGLAGAGAASPAAGAAGAGSALCWSVTVGADEAPKAQEDTVELIDYD